MEIYDVYPNGHLFLSMSIRVKIEIVMQLLRASSNKSPQKMSSGSPVETRGQTRYECSEFPMGNVR
jgi:hypothetical protein